MFRDHELDPDSNPDATGDSRPLGWGVCAICGEDCEEADYYAAIRKSICVRCEDRRNSPPEDFNGEAA